MIPVRSRVTLELLRAIPDAEGDYSGLQQVRPYIDEVDDPDLQQVRPDIDEGRFRCRYMITARPVSSAL